MPAIRYFGLFMALIVGSCWVTVFTIMPPALNMWHRYISRWEDIAFHFLFGWMNCSCRGSNSLPGKCIGDVTTGHLWRLLVFCSSAKVLISWSVDVVGWNDYNNIFFWFWIKLVWNGSSSSCLSSSSSCLSSITRGVVAQSPKPEAHVLTVRAFRVGLEFGSAGFWGKGKTRSTRGKTSRSRERTNNKLSPHMVRAQNQTQATLVGGECSRHCASPAPWFVFKLLLKISCTPKFLAWF